MKWATFITCAVAICGAECARILMVFLIPAPSHYFLGSSLARGLAEAGHDVTMVSPYGEKDPPKKGKYRDVVLTGFLEEKEKQMPFKFLELEDMSPFFNIPSANFVGSKVTQKTMEHPNLKKLLQADEHFDVVILEQFNDDSLKALAHHYKAPLILFSTIGANAWVNFLVGNPSPPSYIPEIFLSYTSDMTFTQRLVNWLFMTVSELNRHLIFFPSQNKLMKEHFPDAPDLSVLNYNASIVLVNSHESINQAVPHVPNMIDIGGFHVNSPKDLPKDLKHFMDSATEGVIYFSMGSNIKPSEMTEDKKEAIVNVLGKLKQKVLWKWDEDTLPGKPSNIKLSKWFPQQDILAHPNTKLFITHGGLLSTTETIYHGVPILAFPIFGDQKMNAARAVANGYGLSLSFSALTEATISDALNKLLNHPQYRDNARRRSTLLHDRPVKPLDLAIYWTEFVIRHRGAPHLRVAGVDLPWYKYLLIDVISFVVLVAASSIFLICFIVRRICCARRQSKDKLKKN